MEFLRDTARIETLRAAMEAQNLQALVCALPKHVLMITGYWPVIGQSIAVVTSDGWVGILSPEDERELAESSWADKKAYFDLGSLERPIELLDAVGSGLAKLFHNVEIGSAAIGIETLHDSVPAPYASVFLYGESLREILSKVVPNALTGAADDLLECVTTIKTDREIDMISRSAAFLERAFSEGASKLLPGTREVEVAAALRKSLSVDATGQRNVQRADGFAYCMSGPNACMAYAAYQRSQDRVFAAGDLALLHVNSYADGYWTDVSRTLPIGEPTGQAAKVLATITEARSAALGVLRPGVKGSDVDKAARTVIEGAGYGDAFRHGLGHGVGFDAINHATHPRLSPASPDVLESGMVFNIEPGIYLPGVLGARHCDMVVMNDQGYRILTDF